VIQEKDEENRTEEPKKEKKKVPGIVEVNLHIEELIEKTSGLSNHEILQIQMDKFHSEMKSAIENRVMRIVFIHGVGNGVLKQEIHKKLKSTYAKYFFQDASFQEYGYGATMVILRRK
jgi:dsDNA-specific endonuclease/ATPase MutS2